ncbi:MAG TPA: hypothetical protein VG736_09960 [Vicinamibacterales bacterium]|nr:hypothetical protein [Vicinamibacterales bacterium]
MEPSRLRRAMLRVFLSLYPSAWKARYRDEVWDVAESLGVTWHVLCDLLRGAVREQVWPSVRYRDSIGALLARVALAYLVSFGVAVAELFAASAIYMSRMPRATIGMDAVMIGPVWTLPFLVSVLAFVCLRRVFVGKSRIAFVSTVVIATSAMSFAWIATDSGAWSLLAYPDALLRAAPVLATLASMYACQTMVVFVILDRRTITTSSEQPR